MHESHLIQGAIRQICEEAAKKNVEHVHSINLKVGLGLGMDEESVRLHFEALAEGTPVEGSAIVEHCGKVGCMGPDSVSHHATRLC